MDVQVREASSSDASSIRDVHLASIEELAGAAYSPEQVSAWAHDRDPDAYPIESSEAYVVVAESSERIVGFGWMKPEADDYLDVDVEGEITAVYVHPSVARQGVGTRIYTELEAEARRLSVESLGLWASLNSVGFYKSQGYTRVTKQTLEFDDAVVVPVVEMNNGLDC